MAIFNRDRKEGKPPSESDEKQLLAWAHSLNDDGHEVRRAQEGQWWENLATFMGDLWTEWNPRDKRLQVTKRKAKHQVRLPINLAQPAIRTELAKLTKNRPIVDVLAASHEKDDVDAAEIGNKILGNYVERQYHMGRVRRRMLQNVLVFGEGGIFVDHDPTAGDNLETLCYPNGEPVIDDREREAVIEEWKARHQAPKYMQTPKGDLRQIPLTPFQLVYDLSVNEFYDSAWCIVTEVFDVLEIERRWGVEVQPETNIYPGALEQRMLERFDRVGKLRIKSPSAQKMAQVHRLYIKPGHAYFPDGLHLAFTKEKVLENEKYPLTHGKLPVGWMGHIDVPTHHHSTSVLPQIKPPVLELSRSESQMVENRNLVSNPPWIIPEQHSIDEGSIVNRPGMRLKYRHAPNIPEPHVAEMPDMPQYVKDMPEMLKEHVLEISGQGETSQGQVPAGARSGVAIAYLQESDDTRLRPTVTEFEETIEYWAEITLRTIAEKFDMPRKLVIAGKHGQPSDILEWTGQMFASFSGVSVQSGSALPRSKAAKQQYILDLWDRQIETDPHKVREALELSEGEPDDYEQDTEQADRENEKLSSGDPELMAKVKAEEWHNHEAHLYKHHQEMKTTDWEESDEDVQMGYREHCADHERMLTEQQRAQAEQQQQQGGQPPPQNGGPPGANGGGPPQAPPNGGPASSLMNATPQ
jgi:hypothetical protein